MSNLTYNQRRYFDERLYFLYVNTYQTKDFTQWISIPKDEREDVFWAEMPSLIEEFADSIETRKYDPFSASSLSRTSIETDTWQPNYDNVMPSYCSGFKSYIGYKLMVSRPLSIMAELDKRFPKPDEIDCYYLTEIFAEVKIDLKNGFGYDPGQQNGLDKYLPPEPALKINFGTAKRWLARAVAKATLLPPVTHNSLPNTPLTNQIQPVANQIMTRPSTTLERSELAEKEYADNKKQFVTRDFLEWEVPIEMPDGTEGIRPYDELIPPYCRRYATALGFTFSCIDAKDVPLFLDKHFRTPDRLDLDYLDDVLTEIESIVGSNYSFSTSAGNGIDYYNGFGSERQMMEAEQNGVETSNKHEWRVIAVS